MDKIISQGVKEDNLFSKVNISGDGAVYPACQYCHAQMKHGVTRLEISLLSERATSFGEMLCEAGT